MDLLTGGAMAVFRIEGFLAAQVVLDLAAMATAFVADLEIFGVVVYFVGSTVLPCVELALGGA